MNAEQILQGFDDILQLDGYDRLRGPSRTGGAPITVAHCRAHARRKLKEVFDRDGSKIAAGGLRRIAEFDCIEAEICGMGSGQRLSARQTRTAPLVAEFGEGLQLQRRRVSAKSRLGEKRACIHRQWDGLQSFLQDGRAKIGSNVVVNLIRAITLTQKNALFAGHDEGGRTWGRVASLIVTAKINGVESFAYLKATLEAIAAGHPAHRIGRTPALELQAVNINSDAAQMPLTHIEPDLPLIRAPAVDMTRCHKAIPDPAQDCFRGSIIRQGKSNDIVSAVFWIVSGATSRHGDILSPVLAQIGHRRGLRSGWQAPFPEQLTRLDIIGAQIIILRPAMERDAADCRDDATERRHPDVEGQRILDAGPGKGHISGCARRLLPDKFATGKVDGRDGPPWRLEAGNADGRHEIGNVMGIGQPELR